MNFESNDFLGNSWKFPIEFKKNLKTVVMLSGEENIKNSLDTLFATRVGERIMHTSYGSALSTFLFTPISKSVKTYMQAVISDEVIFNEPRIVLINIEIEQSELDPGRLDIIIEYKIAATNNRYNYVYPFYMKEATNLDR